MFARKTVAQNLFSNRATPIDLADVRRASPPPAAPSLGKLLLESRTLIDAGKLPLAMLDSYRQAQSNKASGNDITVVMFPAFACDENFFKPLARHLQNLGYQTRDWGLGRNLAGANMPHSLDQLADHWEFELPSDYDPANYAGEGGVAYLCDRAVEQVLAIYQDQSEVHGQLKPLVLLGWSLGGYVAREVARILGDRVGHVITMGSPVFGGPKYTQAAPLFKRRGQDLEWIEDEVARRNSQALPQPVTAIYSKLDGIVDWRATLDPQADSVEHWEVNCAHVGMHINTAVWRVIEQSLERHGKAQPH